jgi:hypothetical protein
MHSCGEVAITEDTSDIEALMRAAAKELGLLEVRLVHYGYRLVPSWMEAPPGWVALGQGMRLRCVGEGADPRAALIDMMMHGRDKMPEL